MLFGSCLSDRTDAQISIRFIQENGYRPTSRSPASSWDSGSSSHEPSRRIPSYHLLYPCVICRLSSLFSGENAPMRQQREKLACSCETLPLLFRQATVSHFLSADRLKRAVQSAVETGRNRLSELTSDGTLRLFGSYRRSLRLRGDGHRDFGIIRAGKHGKCNPGLSVLAVGRSFRSATLGIASPSKPAPQESQSVLHTTGG